MRKKRLNEIFRWRSFVLRYFITCMLIAWTSINVFAQTNKKISISVKNVLVRVALEELQRKAEINFVYNEELVSQTKKISLEFKEASLSDVLGELCKQLSLRYEVQKNLILLLPLLKDGVGDEQMKFEVSGVVTDGYRTPLPGVTVLAKSGKVVLGTATSTDGKYRLTIPSTLKRFSISFSFVGMETKVVEYEGKDTINVVLKEDAKHVEEVVVTGYQTLKKRSQVGSISVVKAEDLVLNGTQSLEQALQGKIPGMMVMNRSGLTGTRQRVRVRGTSTLLGNADPVWVVDGVIQTDPLPFETNDLNNIDPNSMDVIRTFVGGAIDWLNPNDIESVTVLKDASSTAIYGTKAANGVIVITTKKGKVGRMAVSYSGNFSLTPRMTYNKLEVMNSKQRVDVSREAYQTGIILRGNQNIGYTALAKDYRNRKISLEEFDREVKKLETNNTDWFDILFRNAFSHNHSVGISGGNEKATYRASFGYSENYNTAIGNDQKSYTANVSVGANLWKSITLNTSLAGSVRKTRGFVGTDPYSYATTINRALPAHNEDGSRYFYENKADGYLYNIENELENSGTENTVTSLNANINLRWRITDDLSYSTTLSFSSSETRGESWYTERSHYIAGIRGYNYEEFEPGSKEYLNSPLPNGGELNQKNNSALTWNWRNQLEWTKVLNNIHSITAMIGQEVMSSQANGSSQKNYGYMRDRGKIFVDIPPYSQEESDFQNYDIYSQYRTVTTLTESESNTLSYLATLSYMFDNRYALNASVRGDGSNRFGQNRRSRFQPVWSLGFRWNVGFESWLEGQDIISDMSFRVSFGYQGNVAENVSPELTAQIATGSNYDYVLTLKDLPAPELKWEKVSNWNFGIDFSLFKNYISGSFEWYYKKTEDMVVQYKVPYENGVTSRPMNGGSMKNSGWDANFSFVPYRAKDFVISLGFTFSGTQNKINSKLAPTGTWEEAASGNLNKEGYPVSSFWAVKFTGLNPKHGGPEFDLDGWDTDEGFEDATTWMVYAGKMEPDFTSGISFSIRYKNFSLSSGLYLSLGNQQFMAPLMKDMESIPSEYENMSTEWLKRWRKPGDEKHTNVPALPNIATNAVEIYRKTQDGKKQTNVKPYELYAYSKVRVLNEWFLRCNSISCSYYVPEKKLPSFLQSLSFNFSVSNPFQMRSNDFKGRDPEVALGSQPLQRSMSLGVSMSF